MTIEAAAIEFMREYERATATKNFANVSPMLHPNAFYRFTDGDSIGIEAIERAFRTTWERIKNEVYFLTEFNAYALDERTVVVTYIFNWTGVVEDRPSKGEGRGFNMLALGADGRFKIVAELLTA